MTASLKMSSNKFEADYMGIYLFNTVDVNIARVLRSEEKYKLLYISDINQNQTGGVQCCFMNLKLKVV